MGRHSAHSFFISCCVLILFCCTSVVAQCSAFQTNFDSGSSPLFAATPSCAADACQPGWQWSLAEVQYRNNYCMIGVNGTSATAGEIVCTCGMVPGQVSFAIAANIPPGGGGAVAGSVTDISIDTGDGAINLQLFGNDIGQMRFSAYPYNGAPTGDCQANGNLIVASSSNSMFTLSWGTSGAILQQNGANLGKIPSNCMYDMSKLATLKIHVWGCNGQIQECIGTPSLGRSVASSWVSWVNYSPW